MIRIGPESAQEVPNVTVHVDPLQSDPLKAVEDPLESEARKRPSHWIPDPGHPLGVRAAPWRPDDRFVVARDILGITR